MVLGWAVVDLAMAEAVVEKGVAMVEEAVQG